MFISCTYLRNAYTRVGPIIILGSLNILYFFIFKSLFCISIVDATAPMGSASSSPASKKKKTKRVRKADPNVLTVSVGSLVSQKCLQKGSKYMECSSCASVMTGFSQFEGNITNMLSHVDFLFFLRLHSHITADSSIYSSHCREIS